MSVPSSIPSHRLLTVIAGIHTLDVMLIAVHGMAVPVPLATDALGASSKHMTSKQDYHPATFHVLSSAARYGQR